MGKLLILTGLIFMVAGLLITYLPAGIPRLPGDIHIRRENFTFYFPLGWSVVISIIATLVFWLAGKR